MFVEHPLAAMVLSNLSRKGARAVGSQHVRGGSTLGGGGGFRYQADITADTTRVVIEFAFERVGDGPLPDPQRVEIDENGAVLSSPLSADQAEAVLKRVPPACGTARPPASE